VKVINRVGHKVLLVEANRLDRAVFRQVVEPEDFSYNYFVAGNVSEAKGALESQAFDVIITDYIFEDGTVFDILNLVTDTPVIVVTAVADEKTAVNVMKAGAYDYLVKDPALNYLMILPVKIENAIKRKKTEKRLLLLESAVVHANDAIIILEAKPSSDRRGRQIIYVNEAFTRMTGYTFEEATSRTLRIFRGPRTELAKLDKIRRALENFEPVRVELINYRKDGSEFWVECSIVPVFDKKGTCMHWVSVQRDITERKLAEEERERLLEQIESINADLTELNQELETIGAERTMSLMALTVADRVRNPAAMIGGRCRRILEKENLTENLRKNLLYILEGAEELDKIVRDFENFLRNRQSKFRIEDINRVVESVVSVVEREASYKGIKMTVKLSTEPLRIKMQKDLLRVAIFHVVKNAIEATSRGGTITVETFREGDYIAAAVTDTGDGIPEEEVENVFKPFFSTKECGFGMGLPLVRQIISEHLGSLIVESKPGHMTTFKMLFPERWKEEKFCC